MTDRPTLDPDALYVALDRQRRQRRIQWRQIAREAGVSPSTLTRIGQGHMIYADALVRLMAWLGADSIAAFTKREPAGADPANGCGLPA